MKIEVGKYYRTRGGEKVGPMADYGITGRGYNSHHVVGDGRLWRSSDGLNYPDSGGHSDIPTDDLIAEWTDAAPEVGTLQEIGAQVGDVVEHEDGEQYEIRINDSGYPANWSQSEEYWGVEVRESVQNYRIISRAKQGPVREVTRMEIVPGVYGRISVQKNTWEDGKVLLRFADSSGEVNLDDDGHYMSRAELTAAIATLTAIRDAMADSSVDVSTAQAR